MEEEFGAVGGLPLGGAESTRMFVAEIVMEFRVEGDARNAVHVDAVLVVADTPEHAWHAAVELGRAAEHAYVNTDGVRVTKTFRGVRGLVALREGLAHGSELWSTEHVGIPEERLREWIGPREELDAFGGSPAEHAGPNLMPRELARWLLERRTDG